MISYDHYHDRKRIIIFFATHLKACAHKHQGDSWLQMTWRIVHLRVSDNSSQLLLKTILGLVSIWFQRHTMCAFKKITSTYRGYLLLTENIANSIVQTRNTNSTRRFSLSNSSQCEKLFLADFEICQLRAMTVFIQLSSIQNPIYSYLSCHERKLFFSLFSRKSFGNQEQFFLEHTKSMGSRRKENLITRRPEFLPPRTKIHFSMQANLTKNCFIISNYRICYGSFHAYSFCEKN